MDTMFPPREVKSTKKIHRCFGCNNGFLAGSQMIVKSGVWGGDFYSDYWCSTCNAVFDLLPCEFVNSGDGIMPGEIADIIANPAYFGLSEELCQKIFAIAQAPICRFAGGQS